ncbi:sulfatase-like hydrolase/transferase [Pontiellaceae bacterium B1224]|nr:sulfatase-like hydrolase/transferase [Pontiellaceae bacterium B1224]
MAAGLLLFTGSTFAEAERPNIIVLLCDDLGYGDLECYGHPHIKTPHLNQLAAEGMRFTDCYSTAAVCSPSRVGLLTGRNPNRAGIYEWIPNGKQIHMRASEITIPQLLKQAGYATCMSGKWHCNGRFNSPDQPQPDDAGFDYWFATHNNAAPSHENPVNFVRNGREVGPLEGFSCQLVMDEALDWLSTHYKQHPKQPFFMYVTFHEPHEPVASPRDLVDAYQETARNEDEAQYFANVANMDAAVGKLMARLNALDLDENTLVLFTSDNGPEELLRFEHETRSYGRATPLRGMKVWTTEGGVRVPGIMRWPAGIKPGEVSDETVSALDFLPTFCELAGTAPPTDLELDGTSFLPVLENKTIVREKPLLWIYYHAINERRVAMRDGDWKILAKLSIDKYRGITSENEERVKAATLSDFQLFNLSEDIGEANDLSQSHPEKLEELTTLLEAQYQELVQDSYVWGSES